MTREIKFRAWDIIAKYSYDPFVHPLPNNPFTSLNEYLEAFDGKKAILMQYTGLKDKNGREIFEGDLVNSHNGEFCGQVVYQAPSFVIKKTPKAKTWQEFILSAEQNQFQEIIGNIWQSPELLEVKR